MRVSRTLGFTLIEVMMVSFILAVLMSLLFPVFASAKLEGKRASALSNLRQLGLLTNLYRSDYEGDGKLGLPDYVWGYQHAFHTYFGSQSKPLWISPCGTHPDLQTYMKKGQTNLLYVFSQDPDEGFLDTYAKKGEQTAFMFDLNCNSFDFPVTEGQMIRKTVFALKLDGSVLRKVRNGSPYDPNDW